jgi:hypothetical protein
MSRFFEDLPEYEDATSLGDPNEPRLRSSPHRVLTYDETLSLMISRPPISVPNTTNQSKRAGGPNAENAWITKCIIIYPQTHQAQYTKQHFD